MSGSKGIARHDSAQAGILGQSRSFDDCRFRAPKEGGIGRRDRQNPAGARKRRHRIHYSKRWWTRSSLETADAEVAISLAREPNAFAERTQFLLEISNGANSHKIARLNREDTRGRRCRLRRRERWWTRLPSPEATKAEAVRTGSADIARRTQFPRNHLPSWRTNLASSAAARPFVAAPMELPMVQQAKRDGR
jgi:hypothetical protein